MADPHDGHNVGFHEFAHALDGTDGAMDGEPMRPPGAISIGWTHVIATARATVAAALAADREPPIRGYAATDNAELFAVATEWFFERSRELRARLPALHALLRAYYRQDPAT
jgi:Mlc titration factor MtfA (ptsG expression regulator)